MRTALKWTIIAGGAAVTMLFVMLVSPIMGLVLAAVYVALALWVLNEPLVRSTVSWVEKARYAIGAVLVILGVIHFLRSGDWLQMTAALIGVAFITAWVMVERPWQNTI